MRCKGGKLVVDRGGGCSTQKRLKGRPNQRIGKGGEGEILAKKKK